MPPRKPTLPIGFTSLAPFAISGDQWSKIEKSCGFAIPPDLRSTIVGKTQTMRWRTDAWETALPIRDTAKQITGVKRATVEWLKSIEGLPPEVADITMSVDQSEQADLVIKPFMKSVVASCDERLTELASIDAQDARHPWGNWIVELTDQCEQYDLPTGARKDVDKNKAGPSTFVILIYELQQLIEEQYRRATQSVEALADAIGRARSSRHGQIVVGERTKDPPSE